MAILMFRPVPIDQEPKLKNRFVLEFPTELGIESYLVQTSKKPSMKIEKITIPYMNTQSYVAGKYYFEEMEITFIDVIGPSTSQKVMEWVRLHAEPATGKMGYAVGYKKNLVLKALDPVGVEVEKWTLVGCQIVSASFDEYSYEANELLKVSITIQPDRCFLDA
jgi:hypothetical protein